MRAPAAFCLGMLLVGSATACGTVREQGIGDGLDAGANTRTSCDDDLDCPVAEPVCDTTIGFCRGCEAQSECQDKLGRSHCATATGACVACLEDAHCPDAAGVCDGEDYVCRGCETNGECDSGLCDTTMSRCAPDDRIIWVRAGSGVSVDTCGAKSMPCPTISSGLVKASALATTGAGRYMVIGPFTYQPAGTSDIPPGLYVDARGATIEVDHANDATAFTVTGKARWVGGTFDGGADAELGDFVANTAFAVGGGTLELVDLQLRGLGTALRGSGGSGLLTVLDTVFAGNQSSVVASGLGPIQVERSRFVNNWGISVLADTHPAVIRSNLFIHNGQPTAAPPAIATQSPSGLSSVVAFNTFVNNVIGDEGTIHCIPPVATSAGPTLVTSNIVWSPVMTDPPPDDPPPILVCPAEDVRSNLLDVPSGSPFLVNEANHNEDPLFTDVAQDDYSPRDASPAVDAGDPLHAPPHDLQGVSRALGEGPDIGAFERVP